MPIKLRLTLMSFLQFFVWGAWLITMANYWFATMHWSGKELGGAFSTLGLSSLIMPAIVGIIADRWINGEKLYGVLHILSGVIMAYLPQQTDPNGFFWTLLGAMMCYMPTISQSNAVAYTILKNNDMDVVKEFPPIRVWGTIGFIAAMWLTNLTGNKASANMFYISALSSIILGIYSFTLPACPPPKNISEKAGWIEQLGLKAFRLFADLKMALFFIFSMFLGAALQLTNMYGDRFLSNYANHPKYFDSFVVKYSTIIMSISQFSETAFIVAIPFFLKRFGIKKVILFSMIAWVLRFGLFSFGNPSDGLWMIIVSCIVYGLAFDFFNISGSLFVETKTEASIRSSAQGLFMMMTNGVGAVLGSLLSGFFIDKYFTLQFTNTSSLLGYLKESTGLADLTLKNPAVVNLLNGNKILPDQTLESPVFIQTWQPIWLSFAIYSLIVAILFALFFKHKHEPETLGTIQH